MYHFIRDLGRSRYPEIKGLDLADFKGQLAYIRKYYTPIRMEDLIEISLGNSFVTLPDNPILLTFDDGYIEHFTNVFPILDQAGIQGSFFPPAKAIKENQVLDVNKIHFVLASVQEKSRIIKLIFSEINANRKQFSLKTPEYYYEKLAAPNRYDTADVIFIKRILQRELPEPLRRDLIDKLFKSFVSQDEAAFAAELYMTLEQLACMRRNGMYIGSHGYNHYWLNTLNRLEQEREVDRSLEFLESLGCSRSSWVMCYPYGGYNDSLKEVIKNKGCCIGLDTEVAVADLAKNDLLNLPRLDTNDLPRNPASEPVDWTLQILH